MGQFFDEVLGYFEVIWDALSNTLNGLLQATVYISTSSSTVFNILGYMPFVVSSCGLIVVVFMVIKFILGR